MYWIIGGIVIIFLIVKYLQAQKVNQSFDRAVEFTKDPRKMQFLREKSQHENSKLDSISSLLNLLEQELITNEQFFEKLEVIKQKDLAFAYKYRGVMTEEEYNQMLQDGNNQAKAFD